ncbi:MAG: phosphotransferase [Polyangiaceae bacterium]|nr:phosphotransferase [Polyangiaceae bacterium]
MNETFVVEVSRGPVAVLQRLNTRIFVPEVHEDIEAVTRCLRQAGVPTPVLLRTEAGRLWHCDDLGGVWRCLTYEGDRTIHRVHAPADAVSAGRLVARFHAAVADLVWTFRSVRAGAHDTAGHMRGLEASLAAHRVHRLYDEVARVADEVLQRWTRLCDLPRLTPRVIHGDLKISNVRFAGPQALCLIDLDTLARDTLDVELGDAMRSWCNPASEDATETVFDLSLFEAAMRGYARGAADGGRGPSAQECGAIVAGVQRVSLELAARFARDALEECYFGWNPKFGTRGDHNLLRSRGQLALARSVDRVSADAERVVRDCGFGLRW